MNQYKEAFKKLLFIFSPVVEISKKEASVGKIVSSKVKNINLSYTIRVCGKICIMILVITTIHKKENAQRIGKGLLKERLIACYNLMPAESAYWWKGKIIGENEALMIMKTKTTNFKKIEEYIKKHSGYEVPEVIEIDVKNVNAAYLNWINTEVK